MHLEHLGDSSIQGGYGWWMVSMAKKRVSLRFTCPPRANGADDLMLRSAISMLCCGAPMNWGTVELLALSKITIPNPNKIWSLENEIGYFRAQHDHLVVFDVSLIAPMSFKLRTSKDQPQHTLRAPWRLFNMGCPQMMEALHDQNKGVTKVHLPV